ncbi:hypothetical protein A3H26_03730 [candidate division WWE3 bacterium RIFCSPLOWO2_12_FULL_36_10]|uniref:Uncharacterized protein n=1 Tax=candidate division WWE3 bacterium RIFCSPLOWO2_12_FULL_36_10 TaxID=1802630 RepID=A0A1F4VGI7_UNCKA|nr:MAG: hypothetical protein A3H26_03730 [candidate division WWE3 bacterium RIFCSPLOWO2_12_FULL_36_10]
MLDDVGFAPILIMGLVFLAALIVEILVSLGITLILKRVLERKGGAKKGSGFVIPITLVIFILLNVLLKISYIFRIN